MTVPHVQSSKAALMLVIGVVLTGVVLAAALVLFSTPIYVLIGVLGILLAIVFLKKPLLGTYFIIISFPFLSTLPRGVYVPGLKLDEILIILFLGLNLLLPAKRIYFRFTQIDIIYLVIFLAGSLLPFMGAYLRGQQPNWVEAVALLKPFMLYHLVVVSFNNRRQLAWALGFLLIGSLFVAMVAILQLVNFADVRSLLARIYYDTSAPALLRGTFNRATSTLGNWNALGGYAALGALLCLSLLRYRKAINLRLLILIALAANIGMLLLAGSSSSLIGFFIGLVVFWIMRPNKRRLPKGYPISLLLVFILILIVFAVMGRTVIEEQIQRQMQLYVYDRVTQSYYPTHGIPASIIVRWLLSKSLLRTIIEDRTAMLTGFGTGTDAIELLPWGTPESGYMAMFFFYGPLFVFLYLLLFIVIFSMSLKLKARLDKMDDLGLSLTTAVSIIAVSISFMNIIHSYYSAAGVTHYFWILIGCMVALAKINYMESQIKSPEVLAGA
jgi:hypothetical protein